MAFYKKDPVVVEAIQISFEGVKTAVEFAKQYGVDLKPTYDLDKGLVLETPDQRYAYVGDWLVLENGGVLIVQNSTFKLLYHPKRPAASKPRGPRKPKEAPVQGDWKSLNPGQNGNARTFKYKGHTWQVKHPTN